MTGWQKKLKMAKGKQMYFPSFFAEKEGNKTALPVLVIIC